MLRISTNNAEMDVPLIHGFLSNSYWARDITREIFERAIEHSLCFGGFIGPAQAAFARVITDFAAFANLVDVFVLPERRGSGYGTASMQAVFSHPQLQGLRRFTLATADAHGLYARFGFAPPTVPQALLERYSPNIYQDADSQQA
jgi:GNAT superfamily N-acetyltransferase